MHCILAADQSSFAIIAMVSALAGATLSLRHCAARWFMASAAFAAVAAATPTVFGLAAVLLATAGLVVALAHTSLGRSNVRMAFRRVALQRQY